MIRDGRERELPVEELVPGDLLVLREGERVPADGRLVERGGLAVDESALTGESVPNDKAADAGPGRCAARRPHVAGASRGTAVTARAAARRS